MPSLKVVDSFDHSFELASEAKSQLFTMLQSEPFCQAVSRQTGCDRVEFTEHLFQPAPYTAAAPKGMPVEYEQYYDSPDYIIINVPPHFMFNAKIFKPSRLCAIYRQYC